MNLYALSEPADVPAHTAKDAAALHTEYPFHGGEMLGQLPDIVQRQVFAEPPLSPSASSVIDKWSRDKCEINRHIAPYRLDGRIAGVGCTRHSTLLNHCPFSFIRYTGASGGRDESRRVSAIAARGLHVQDVVGGSQRIEVQIHKRQEDIVRITADGADPESDDSNLRLRTRRPFVGHDPTMPETIERGESIYVTVMWARSFHGINREDLLCRFSVLLRGGSTRYLSAVGRQLRFQPLAIKFIAGVQPDRKCCSICCVAGSSWRQLKKA